MNKVHSYIKNLGKSVKYAAVDVVKEMNPAITEFATTNTDLFKEINHMVRDRRNVFDRTKNQLMKSKVYEAGDAIKTSIFEDLRTGKFYNKDRTDLTARAIGMGGDDEWDIDVSFDDSFGEDWNIDDVSLDSKHTSSVIARHSKASAEAISTSVLRSSEYIVESQKSMQQFNTMFQMENFNKIHGNLGIISQNIAKIVEFNTTAQTVAMNNAKTYYEETTKLMREQTALMKEFVEMERNRYASETKNDKKSSRIGYSDITSNGVPNLKTYMQAIGKNIKGMSTGMGALDMFGENSNALLEFATSPLAFIPKAILKKLIPYSIKKSTETLNKSVESFFGSLITRLNTMAEDGNAIEKIIGKVFGVRHNSKRSIDTDKYEKGKVAWDGVSRQALVEVIPTYLRQMVSLLSGKSEQIYDYESGKFSNASSIKKSYDNIFKNEVKSSMSEIRDDMMKTLSLVGVQDKDRLDSIQKDMTTFFEYFAGKGKLFDHNRKDYNYYDEQGLGIGRDNYQLLEALFKSMPKNMQHMFNRNIQDINENVSSTMYRLEEKGDSVFRNVANGSNADQFRAGKGEKNYGIGGGGYLLKVKDRHGKNIYDYLKTITAVLETGIKTYVVNNMSGASNAILSNNPVVANIPKSARTLKTKGDADKILNRNLDLNRVTDRTYEEIEADQKNRDRDSHKRREIERMGKRGINTDISQYESDETSQNPYFALRSKRATQDILDYQKDYQDSRDWVDRNIIDKINSIAKKNNKEIKGIGIAESSQTFLNDLIKSDTLFDKFKLTKQKLAELKSKPVKMVQDVIERVDLRLYEVIYGKEGRNYKGKKVKGFLDMLTVDLEGTFEKFNDWMNEKVLKPLSDKISGMGGKFDKVFGSIFAAFGLDWDSAKSEMKGQKDKFKDRFFNSVKGGFNSAKKDVLSVYRPAWYNFAGGNTTLDSVGNIANDPNKDAKAKIDEISKKLDPSNSPFAPTPEEKSNLDKVKEIINGASKSHKERDKRLKRGLLKNLPKAPTDGEDPFEDIRKALNSDDSNIDDIYDQLLSSDNIGYKLRSMIKVGKNKTKNDDTDIVNLVSGIDSDNKKTRPKNKSIIDKAKDEINKGINNVSTAIFGRNPDDPDGSQAAAQRKKVTEDIMQNIKKYAPEMAASGLFGSAAFLGLGLLGGPIVGLGLGAGYSLLKNSDELQNYLFGPKDENGERIGSKFVSKGTQDTFKKYFPDMKKFGITGAVTAMIPFVPGGPVAGLLIGSALGFAKNNEGIQKSLFGEEGALGPKFKEKLDKFLPKGVAGAGIGAVGLGMMGPFGILGGAAVGAGLGLLTGSDKFNEAILGKYDEKTKRYENGLIPMLRDTVLVPAKDWMKTQREKFNNYFGRIVGDNLKLFFKPFLHESKKFANSIIEGTKSAINSVFEKAVGKPLHDVVEKFVVKPSKKLFDMTFGLLIKVVGGLFSFPFKTLGNMGKKMRAKHIKSGEASSYMSEEEIEQFQKDNPKLFLQEAIIGNFFRSITNPIQAFKDKRKLKSNDSKFVNDMNKITSETREKLVDGAQQTSKAYGSWRDRVKESYKNFKEKMKNKVGNYVQIANRQNSGGTSEEESGSSEDSEGDRRKISRGVLKSSNSLGKLNEDLKAQLDARDEKINKLEAMILDMNHRQEEERKAKEQDAKNSKALGIDERNRIIREDNKHLKIIADEIKGQLDGVGNNVDAMRKILANEFGDQEGLGIKGERGNKTKKGFFARFKDFLMNPLKAFKGKAKSILFGEDGKSGLLGGAKHLIGGLFKGIINVITAPFKAIGFIVTNGVKLLQKTFDFTLSAVKGFGSFMLETVKMLGPAIGEMLKGAVNVITTGLGAVATVIEGMASGIGKASEYIIAGLGSMAGAMMDMMAVVPGLIKNLGDLTVSFGTAALEFGVNLSKTLMTTIAGGAASLGNLLFGDKSMLGLEFGVVVNGGHLDSVDNVKVVSIVEKLMVANNVRTVELLKSLPMASGMATPYGVIRYDADSSGNLSPINDDSFKGFMANKAIEDGRAAKVLQFNKEQLDESKKISENTSFLSKLGEGIGGMFDLVSRYAPFLIVGLPFAIKKIMEILGIKDKLPDTSTDGITKVGVNALRNNKVTRKILDASIRGTIGTGSTFVRTFGDDVAKVGFKQALKNTPKTLITAIDKGGLKGAGTAGVKAVSNAIFNIFGSKAIQKVIGKEAAEAIMEKFLPILVKEVGEAAVAGVAKGAVKGGIKAAAGVSPLAIATISYDLISGMHDASNIFMTTNVTLGMRITAGVAKVINSYVTLGILPLQLIVPIIFKIICGATGNQAAIANMESMQNDLKAEAEAYNQKNGKNLSLSEYNNMRNKSMWGKIKDHTVTPFTDIFSKNKTAGQRAKSALIAIAKLNPSMVMGYNLLTKMNSAGMLDSTKSLASKAWNGTKAFGGRVVDTAKDIGAGALSIGKSMISFIGEALDKLGDTTMKGLKFGAKILYFPFYVTLTALRKTGVLDKIVEIKDLVVNKITTFVKSIVDGVVGTVTWIKNTVTKKISDAISFVKDFGIKLWDITKSIATTIWGKAKDAAWDYVINPVVDRFNKIKNGITYAWDVTKAVASNIGNFILDKAKAGVNYVVNLGKEGWSVVKTGILAAGDFITSLFSKFFGEGTILRKIINVPLAGLKAAADFVGGVVDKIGGFISKIGSLGKKAWDFVEGDSYWGSDGIKSGLGSSYGRGATIARDDNGSMTPKTLMTHYYQKDPKWSNKNFNSSLDKVRQNIGDSGCGPTSAAMVATAFGKTTTPDQAANYVIKNGFKETNGGTKLSFFKKFAESKGLETGSTTLGGAYQAQTAQGIADKLKRNIPVILMGKSSKSSKNTPFGQNMHYVVATGIDNNQVVINDPERPYGGLRFSLADTLKDAKNAIWTTFKGKGYKSTSVNSVLSKESVLTPVNSSLDGLYAPSPVAGQENEKQEVSTLDKVFKVLSQLATSAWTGKFSLEEAINESLSSDNVGGFTGNEWVTGKLGIHQFFGDKLTKLAQAYKLPLMSTSGYRSIEEQQALWAARKAKYPNESDAETAKWVAKPGTSRHQAGLAVDMGTEFFKKLSASALAKFGLYKPMSYEDWHIEPIETKGLSTDDLVKKFGLPGGFALDSGKPLSANAFISKVKRGALMGLRDYNILPSITVAQAALESGWGKKSIGNNIFGVKAGSGWTGATRTVNSAEYDKYGNKFYKNSVFRDYPTVDASIQDHNKILGTSSYYSKFRLARNYAEAARALTGVYASDPQYGNTLINLIRQNGLDKLDNRSVMESELYGSKTSYGKYGLGSGPKYGMGSGPSKSTSKTSSRPMTFKEMSKLSTVSSSKQPVRYSSGNVPRTVISSVPHYAKTSSNSGSIKIFEKLLSALVSLLERVANNTDMIYKIIDILSNSGALPKDKIEQVKNNPAAIPNAVKSNSTFNAAEASQLVELLTQLAK